MSVHLVKLAVGVEDVDHLRRIQRARIEQNVANGLSPLHRHVTRMTPKRQDELLDGGSLYWVIKGMIRVRQKVVGFENFTDDEGVRRCAFVLDPELVPTQNRPQRAFQGWRYLPQDKAPKDAEGGHNGELPTDLVRDLEDLGLL